MRLFRSKPFAPAVAVAIASGLAMGCGRNQPQTGWWEGERERIELSHQLELEKFRFEQVSSNDCQELERLRGETNRFSNTLKALREQRAGLCQQIESLQGQWAGFKEGVIRTQRQRAIGKTFETFNLVSGRRYQAVSVTAIDDAGVTIRHQDGSARLRFADLTDDQQVFFGLEADLAVVAQAKESRDAAAYERWIASRIAASETKDEADAEIARRREQATRERRIQLAAQQLAAFKARPLAQPASSFGGRSWRSDSYSGYRSRRPTYRYVYYNNSNNSSCGYSPPEVPAESLRRVVRDFYFPEANTPSSP